jgi:ubiquinone/menaquinone biosynthesis C-methylase UbiE
VLDGARLAEGDDVLHLGATDGLLTFGALERIGEGWLYAVDPSVAALEELERQAEEIGAAGIAYLVGDARVLPLPDASVDAVVARPFAVDEDVDETARELHRVLRSGGRMSVAAPIDHDADGLTRSLQDAGFADVQLERDRDATLVRARRP